MVYMQLSVFARFLFLTNLARKVYSLPTDDIVRRSVDGKSLACDRVEVRREWRDINRRQRTKWVKAAQCLSRKPHNSKLIKSSTSNGNVPAINSTSSRYDDFAYLHADLRDQFHGTGLFLPFHRRMLQAYYDTLKEECGYTGSVMYWDWTRDVGDLEHSKIWDDFQYALGGLGDPAQSYFVMSGGFKSIQLAYPTPHRLKRQLTIKSEDGAVFNTSFTKNKVEEALACGDGDLECFQTKIEEVDEAVESIIGGDLASYFSPNDPLFYLHHASIDRIWWLWQNKSPKNANTLAGGLEATKIPSDGLYEEWQIGDVLDTQNGKLCYIYY